MRKMRGQQMAKHIFLFQSGPETQESLEYWLEHGEVQDFLELAGFEIMECAEGRLYPQHAKVLAAILRQVAKKLVQVAEKKL